MQHRRAAVNRQKDRISCLEKLRKPGEDMQGEVSRGMHDMMSDLTEAFRGLFPEGCCSSVYAGSLQDISHSVGSSICLLQAAFVFSLLRNRRGGEFSRLRKKWRVFLQRCAGTLGRSMALVHFLHMYRDPWTMENQLKSLGAVMGISLSLHSGLYQSLQKQKKLEKELQHARY
jgi:hypothetical protein